MANIKQQIKRNKTNEKRRLRNASFKSATKTAIKAVLSSIEANDKEAAQKALAFAFKKLDKGLAKGIYHSRFVARNKSNLSRKVHEL